MELISFYPRAKHAISHIDDNGAAHMFIVHESTKEGLYSIEEHGIEGSTHIFSSKNEDVTRMDERDLVKLQMI